MRKVTRWMSYEDMLKKVEAQKAKKKVVQPTPAEYDRWDKMCIELISKPLETVDENRANTKRKRPKRVVNKRAIKKKLQDPNLSQEEKRELMEELWFNIPVK